MSQRRKPVVLFPPPGTPTLDVERVATEGACASCGSERLERYRLLRVSGWVEVTRCAACLEIAGEEAAPTPLGFTYTPYASYLRE